MKAYLDTFINGYKGYGSYLWHEITHPGWHNYFYWLIGISLFFFGLELLKPWRRDQPKFRRDFWLDVFYMFFNFFLFSLIIYNAASEVIVKLMQDAIHGLVSVDISSLNPLQNWPLWAVLLFGFVLRDFVQWWTHRLLHRVEFLWEFHKVHHSVREMGFAAHLRYHWMETIVYRTIEYLPLALCGIGLYDFFIIHIFSLIIGHYNHSNVSISKFVTGGILGFAISFIIVNGFFEIGNLTFLDLFPHFIWLVLGAVLGSLVLGRFMKILFNSPEMHIWHHAMNIPAERRHGVNFGLSLAIWDYMFGTAYVPHEGRDIELGFPDVEEFPKGFKGQITHGF